MVAIWKFQLLVSAKVQNIEMPLNAKIILAQSQHDLPTMWAILDTDQIKEVRYFELFGTGHQISTLEKNRERKYINTIRLYGGDLLYKIN